MTERLSNFRAAIGPDVVICPHCGATNLGPNSLGVTPSSTIELQQNGSYLCNTCSENFIPQHNLNPIPKENV